ncbi:MAG: hypothetical protein IKM72_02670, partial [Oscillospiraceae bacterium]|nr:hypothetical protein [Oscillospiraceae bacterium]
FDAKGDGGAMANRIVTKDGDRVASVINPTYLGAVVKVGDPSAATDPTAVPTAVPTGTVNTSEQPESKTEVANGESALKIDAGKYKANAGDTIKVKIKVTDTKDGFNAINSWLDIDTDVFDIVSMEAGDTDDEDNGDSHAYSNVTINKFHKDNAAENITTILCLYSDTNNATEDMVLATVELKIKAGTKDGYYTLPFDAKGDGGAMANRVVTKDGDRVPVILNPTYLGALVEVGDVTPTAEPTETPTVKPTETPTVKPTETPTADPTAKNTSGEIIYGDVNSDGKVDVTDLSLLSLYLLDKTGIKGDGLKAADVNGDGSVALTDLATLRQFISKKITKLGPDKK